MKDELAEALFRDFQNLYSRRERGMDNLMYFGFSVLDGWEPLIRRLSEKLEALIVVLPEKSRGDFYAFQVKEKFGGLRFYMSQETDDMTEAIGKASEESARTCESCGEPGKLRRGSWIRCLCEGHADGRAAFTWK